ncbi:hypothetical protein U27_00395 [Candidatus Vecturithrix granuli]|uniref:Uncharacterized protein n=1 Tax=Vecturithrix granuli TaxID=1499967 RepID=A0A081C7E3_VECG1|nr:hypothetical protein U27_00395 [Candidatus Vecturithrix granuli]
MWEDPIIKELHAMRAAHAEQFKYDIDAMFQELHEKERQSGVHYVSYAPKHLNSGKKAATRRRLPNKKHKKVLA